MATAAATVDKLTKERQHLQGERDRLMAEGQELHDKGQLAGALGSRISELEDRIKGLSLDLGEASRDYGHRQARGLPANSEYQAKLAAALATLEPWAALAQATHRLRGEGVIVPGLPLFATTWLNELKVWLGQMIGAGVVDLDALPPAIQKMVREK